jgi:hypothetical protein
MEVATARTLTNQKGSRRDKYPRPSFISSFSSLNDATHWPNPNEYHEFRGSGSLGPREQLPRQRVIFIHTGMECHPLFFSV